MIKPKDLDQLCINTIRTLSIDAVQKANSGHPGTPMDASPTVYCLWQRFLRYDPEDPDWANRDRFVLSSGHASALLYSLIYLAGIKAANPTYEQLGRPARTAEGHPPERGRLETEPETKDLGARELGRLRPIGQRRGGLLEIDTVELHPTATRLDERAGLGGQAGDLGGGELDVVEHHRPAHVAQLMSADVGLARRRAEQLDRSIDVPGTPSGPNR